MSFNTATLRAKYTAETVLLPPGGFDFTSMLAVGETISSATTGISIYTGNDPAPQNVLSGNPTVVGNKVQQLFTNGVAGTIYNIAVKAVTSLGQTLEIDGFLVVIMSQGSTSFTVLAAESGSPIETEAGQELSP